MHPFCILTDHPYCRTCLEYPLARPKNSVGSNCQQYMDGERLTLSYSHIYFSNPTSRKDVKISICTFKAPLVHCANSGHQFNTQILYVDTRWFQIRRIGTNASHWECMLTQGRIQNQIRFTLSVGTPSRGKAQQSASASSFAPFRNPLQLRTPWNMLSRYSVGQ